MRYIHVNKFVPQGGVIVDIGCGREAAFLKENSKHIQNGYGFDFRIADQTFDNIQLVNNKNLPRLPLADESVDAVFLNAVLEHIPEPLPILREAHRALKAGGKLVMTTPSRAAKPVLEFLAFRLHIINEDEIREHCHYWNRADVVKLADDLNMNLALYRYFELWMNTLMVLVKP